MVYTATTGVIIYCNPHQPFFIHGSHHAWFDEYNSRISMEDKNTPSCLLLKQDLERILHILYLLDLIPCELSITSTPFCDTTILTYEIELPPSGNKFGLNLLDEYFTIHYGIDTVLNSPAGHQLPTQANKNVWIIAINGEYLITVQGALDKLQSHQARHVKSKVDIGLFRRKSYQRTDLEDIRSRFDKFVPMVSHLEVSLPEKPISPKNIYGYLKGPHRPFWKEYLFVQYYKGGMLAFFWLPYRSNPSLVKQSSSICSLLPLLRKATVMVHGNYFHATVKMVVIRFKVFICISPTVQWHMITPS